MEKVTKNNSNKNNCIEQPTINDLLFKELLRRGYSLEGHTRIWNIADSKLWYLTPDQAQAYLDLENSKEYRKNVDNDEFVLIEGVVPELTKKVENGPINIIDLGCGDGLKASHIIDHLKKKVRIKYCPIDISGYMVAKAIETVSKVGVDKIIGSQWNISDFENLENIVPLLAEGEKFKKNLFLLLGFTLGNFEIHELLYAISHSMNSGDLFLVTAGLGSSRWENRAETAKNDEKTNKFFSFIPMQLGLCKEDVEFGARFINSRIEFFYTLNKDKTIKFQKKHVEFYKGDQIIVAVAYKQAKEELTDILKMYFKTIHMYTSPDESTALVLCEK
jgi:uncharacterized SAM-dependent methyltransferase